MKKTVVFSLVAALALTSSSVVAQAKPVDSADNQTVKVQAVKVGTEADISGVKLVTTEITGAIEDISEHEMKVKVKDGESYIVPLGLFSKQEGFKELGLAKGVEVTLKSVKPDLSQTNELKTEPALTIEGVGDIRSADAIEMGDKVIKVFPGTEGGQKLEEGKIEGNVFFSFDGNEPEIKSITLGEGEQFFFATEITANGKTVKAEKIHTVIAAKKISDTMPAELSGTVQSINETEMTVKTKDGKIYTIPLAAFNKKDEFKELEIKSGTEVLLKSSPVKKVITITGKGTDATIKTDGSGGEKIIISKSEIKEIPEGKLIFIVDEITANGKTVKLSK